MTFYLTRNEIPLTYAAILILIKNKVISAVYIALTQNALNKKNLIKKIRKSSLALHFMKH